MVKLIRQGVYFMEGRIIKDSQAFMTSDKREKAIKNTVLYSVLASHIAEKGETLQLKTDSVAAQGADAVEVFQIAEAAGVSGFALPFTAVGGGADCGAFRADENTYCLSAAKKFGADYAPSRLSDLGEALREFYVKSGEVVLGANVRPACGALGAMGIQTNSENAVKALSGKPYIAEFPQTVAVYLKGKLRKGVGALDVALSLVQATSDFAEHKILEFFGTGISNLTMEQRSVIDASIAATGCLTTVWETDSKTEEYLKERGREKAFKKLAPKQPAYYDWGITVDLSRVEPMIALSSRVIMPLQELLDNPEETLAKLEKEGASVKISIPLRTSLKKGKIVAENGFIGGGYETLAEVSELLNGAAASPSFSLRVAPVSQSAFCNLAENGYAATLLSAGAELRSAGCGYIRPSFGGLALSSAVDAICEDSSVVIMDAHSIATTAKNGGVLTSALDCEYVKRLKKYRFDAKVLGESIYRGAKKPNGKEELPILPAVISLPQLPALDKNLLLKVVACLKEPIGEKDLYAADKFSRHRSNPQELALHTLEGKDVLCKERGESVRIEAEQWAGGTDSVKKDLGEFKPAKGTMYGGVLFANELHLNTRRERTALALRLFGCRAVVCKKETDEETRKALVSAGILPLTVEKLDWKAGDTLYLADVAGAVSRGDERIVVKILTRGKSRDVALGLGALTAEERAVLLAGGSINSERG